MQQVLTKVTGTCVPECLRFDLTTHYSDTEMPEASQLSPVKHKKKTNHSNFKSHCSSKVNLAHETCGAFTDLCGAPELWDSSLVLRGRSSKPGHIQCEAQELLSHVQPFESCCPMQICETELTGLAAALCLWMKPRPKDRNADFKLVLNQVIDSLFLQFPHPIAWLTNSGAGEDTYSSFTSPHYWCPMRSCPNKPVFAIMRRQQFEIHLGFVFRTKKPR